MKISFFIGSMRRGGAERVISILANHYSQKGWEVEIALLLDTTVGYELNENIKVVDLTAGKGSYIKRMPMWLKKIRNYVKSSKPDRVVSFIGRINVLVLNALRGLKVPVIVSERNDPKHDGRGAVMLWLCNKSYKKASAIVHQTKYEESCFSPKLATKSYIVPNPVNVAVETKSPVPYRIVTAGRLLPQKNHAMLIDAVAMLKDEFPEVKLDIYGDGSLKDNLSAKIKEMNLEDMVFLMGNVSDLHQRIADADVFAMTSEFEGLSNALIEAMMLGLVCVSTDYPGADEVVKHEENGLLVPCRDANKLSEVLRQLFKGKELNSRLRNNAKETSQKYRPEEVIKKWEAVIEK